MSIDNNGGASIVEGERIVTATYEALNLLSKEQNSKTSRRYFTHHESSRKDST